MNATQKLIEDTITECKIRRDQVTARKDNLEKQIATGLVDIQKLDESIADLQKGLKVLNEGPT